MDEWTNGYPVTLTNIFVHLGWVQFLQSRLESIASHFVVILLLFLPGYQFGIALVVASRSCFIEHFIMDGPTDIKFAEEGYLPREIVFGTSQ